MFPPPIIPNQNIEPIYNDILKPNNIYYRANSNGSVSRLAIQGSEYDFYEQQNSKVVFKIPTWYSIGFPGQLNAKLYFRVRFNNNIASVQISPWNAGQLFKQLLPANTWHEIRVEYGATATSTHRWYVNNVLKYTGPKNASMDFFFNITGGNNDILFDVGNRGGVLPDGYTWWPDPVV